METHLDANAAMPEPPPDEQHHIPQPEQPEALVAHAAAAAAGGGQQIEVCLPVGDGGEHQQNPNKRKFEEGQVPTGQEQPEQDQPMIIPMRVDSKGREIFKTPFGNVTFPDTPVRWYPNSIKIEAQTFDGQSVNADLMKVIGRGVKANKCTLTERFYLPPQYNRNTAEYRAKTIAPIFASACAVAGCEVRLKGWEKTKGFLKFVCPHYRRYKAGRGGVSPGPKAPPKAPPSAVNGTSKQSFLHDSVVRPVSGLPPEISHPSELGSRVSRGIGKQWIGNKEGVTCPFSFLVFWEEYPGQENVAVDERQGRWFICATGAGTPYHRGHLRKSFSQAEIRRKQLHVEGAYEILLPFYKKIVQLIERDEEKLNSALEGLCKIMNGLKKKGKLKAEESEEALQEQEQTEKQEAASGLTHHNQQQQTLQQEHQQHQEHEAHMPEPVASPQYHHDSVMPGVDDLVNLAASTHAPLPQHPSAAVGGEAASGESVAGADTAATEAALALDQSVINEVATL